MTETGSILVELVARDTKEMTADIIVIVMIGVLLKSLCPKIPDIVSLSYRNSSFPYFFSGVLNFETLYQSNAWMACCHTESFWMEATVLPPDYITSPSAHVE